MASRKGINVYIPQYFRAIRSCTNSFLLYGLEMSLLTYSYIGELHNNGWKFKCENEPFIVLILILTDRRVLY